MAAPIVGPILTENYNDVHGAGSFWEWKQSYRQARPYRDVLPYVHWKRVTLEDVYGNAGARANAHAGHSPWYLYASPKVKGDPDVDWCVNKARNNFIQKVANGGQAAATGEFIEGTSSQLGSTFAERRQAADTIRDRSRQLRQLLRHLKNGKVELAAKTLVRGDDITYNRLMRATGRSRSAGLYGARLAANQWLEWWFGILPTVKDIYDAAQVFSKPLPLGKIQAGATYRQVNVGEANFWPEWRDYGSQLVKVKCRVGASVRVSNPDLYLAQRLGLVNLASVALEVTPWSFVFDWVVNISDYVGSLTDTLGLEFEQPWHSTKTTVDGTYWSQLGYGGPRTEIKTTCETFVRYVGLPEVTLSLRPYKDISVTRAATAIALLVQQLPARDTKTLPPKKRVQPWKGTLL